MIAWDELFRSREFWGLLCAAADDAKIRAAVREDWQRVGIINEKAAALFAEKLWVGPANWRDDPALGAVNDGEYSFRNPQGACGKRWLVDPGSYEAFAKFLSTSKRSAMGIKSVS